MANRLVNINKSPVSTSEIAPLTPIIIPKAPLDMELIKIWNKKKKKASSLLQDDRFTSMFNDTDFQVDTTSHEYKLHHPSESNAQKMAKRFEPVQGEEDDEENDDIIRFSNIKQTNKNKKDAKLSKSKNEPKFFELKVWTELVHSTSQKLLV